MLSCVTFHGIYIYVYRGNPLSLISVMHLWATLGCGMFSCHCNLVWPVRGALDPPSVKSVAHRAVSSRVRVNPNPNPMVVIQISSSSDVKASLINA